MADILIGEWAYNGAAPPPGGGQIRMDSGTPGSVTKVTLAKADANGADASAGLTAWFKLNNRINLQVKSDPTTQQTYAITATPIDQGTYMEYPVAWLSGGTALPGGSRINVYSVSIPASVTVQSPALQASVGTSTFRLGVGQAATGVALAVTTGTSTFRLGIALPATGAALDMTTGTPAFKLDHKLRVFGQRLDVQVGVVEVIDQVLLPGQAFPSDTPAGFSPGMTTRQWHASHAMMGFIAYLGPSANLVGRVADLSFRVADSMIEFERKEAAGIIRPPVPARSPPFPPSVLPVPPVPPNTLNEKQVEALQVEVEALQVANARQMDS